MTAELAHALIHESNLHLLNAYYVLSIMLDTGLSDETDLIHVISESMIWSGGLTRNFQFLFRVINAMIKLVPKH